MKNIIFIGAGGFGSECYQYLLDVMNIDKNIFFKGFLSTSNDLAPYGLQKYFLGHYDDYDFEENDYLVIAIGSPIARYRLYHHFKSKGLKFYNLISPKAFITHTNNIGECNVIAPFSTLGINTIIGHANLIGPYSLIGHDCRIGDFNFVSSYVSFGGGASIGNLNFLAHKATLTPKTLVQNNCTISANSVVSKKLRDNSIALGNPAETIGTNPIQENYNV
ncbi:hypothetical protein [Helicobacter cappadocius]|uniref:PglD N-terminal domain-containing protein n=1 Tax=Helicobacter cappadocius TaxID=3063998 RepID=A0AA90PRA6_9HELI|nr:MULTISPECIES: hypothetical protein [unclassified Helicobacter]MDO7253942.1 hypothetical protein [Helicobacter sp. faydin-H75]MDP2538692.1 hypothetical protein [Helicobacter sp. faydin-H76]